MPFFSHSARDCWIILNIPSTSLRSIGDACGAGALRPLRVSLEMGD